MAKKHNECVLISSLEEIRPSLRIKAKRTAYLIGFLALLVVLLGFLAFGVSSQRNSPFFLYGVDWLLMVSSHLFAYGVGYVFGLNVALWDMGFVLPVGDNSFSSQTNHDTDSSSNYHGYSFGSSVSINPSSGHPMSGSSGIDTYGNPYGTRSW